QIRVDDLQGVFLVPIGEAQVDANFGAVRLSQPLDFDQSPGTSVGGYPMLVYNSASGAVRPIIQVAVDTDPNQRVPSQIEMQLTWNRGSPQGWVSYYPFFVNAGDILVGAVQVNTAVAQTDYYSWSLDVKVHDGATTTYTIMGNAAVVVQDSSVSGQKDPF